MIRACLVWRCYGAASTRGLCEKHEGATTRPMSVSALNRVDLQTWTDDDRTRHERRMRRSTWGWSPR